MPTKILTIFGCFILCVAQVSAETVETFTDWDMVCPPALEDGSATPSCHLSHTAQAPDKQFNLLLSTIVRRDNGLVLIMTTPLGIDLSPGLTWQVDARPKRQFIFNTCTVEGCFAAIQLDHGLVAELRRGNRLKATYHDGSGKPVHADISLSGFTTATSALQK